MPHAQVSAMYPPSVIGGRVMTREERFETALTCREEGKVTPNPALVPRKFLSKVMLGKILSGWLRVVFLRGSSLGRAALRYSSIASVKRTPARPR